MPSINVRLTDEQHQELRQAVFRRGRHWSIQKEIVDRLFQSSAEHLNPLHPSPASLDLVATVEVGEAKVGKIARPVAPQTAERDFRPDFKREKKK